MSTNKTLIEVPSRNGLLIWLSLGGLFVAGLLTIVVGGLVFDIVTGIASAHASAKGQKPASQELYRQLPPDLETELNNALLPTSEWSLASIKNTMADRERIGEKDGQPVIIKSTLPPPPGSLTANPANLLPQPTPPPLAQPTPDAAASEKKNQEELKNRVAQRDAQARRGESVAPLNEYFDIEDVSPLGAVGDSLGRQIMFYSPATKRTFAAALGTRFRDGTFIGVTDEGVKFLRAGDNAEIIKKWARSMSDKAAASGKKTADNDSANDSTIRPEIILPTSPKAAARSVKVNPRQN